MDLYVRFGEDNTIQDGGPVSDHVSLDLTGNERIGITRRSVPPLRAGTYFVSIAVFATGVVAEGTLTATVETDAADCHLDATCYPEWSSSASGVALIAFETSEGSYACSGTLLNNRRQDLTPYFLTAAHCVQTEEAARSVTAFWSYQTQTCNGDLPDLRSVPQTEGAGLISTLGGADRPDGDMTLLQLEGDLPDAIVFQGWDADPQPIGAQVTGIHHPGSDDWGVFKRIAFGQIIPESVFGTTDDTYFNVSYPVGQGYTERGSSGSAIFSNSETVVGALSGGDIVGYACPTEPVVDVFTHFSVFYPHIRPFIDSTLPEISGGALPPGQPAAFRLGPVDAPMLFSGDSSFQVEVPEGATRVTFTLESIDPDVNVDLYVRYGEDNAIQDGNVVSDYSSEGSTGNEQIVVTRQSDPPLRAGTYFVSLMLRTTGAVAEVTVTAEFDAPPPTGGQIYYFPHLAVGQKWQTTITYINYSSQEVRCTTEFLSDQGTPLMVSFADKGTVPSRTDVLQPGGSVHQETDVELSAPLVPGWARATCSGQVKASLLYRQHNSEGVPSGEGGVNAAAVPATRFVTFAEQGEGQFGTGVAYANPSPTEAIVTFTARDADGLTLASEDLMLPPNGHAARNMKDLFGLSSFTGSLEVTSTVPIVSLSINAEAAPVFSSLPPGELDASAQGSTTYYFPHIAVGAGWQTTITYINYSPEEVTCRTDFLSDHGSPLRVSFAGRGMDISRSDVLPPGGSVHQETNVELSAPLAPGWARATCSGAVKASLLFRLHNSEGVSIAEGGVNAAAVPATRFVTFAEQGEGQFGTGVAYANPSPTEAIVTFTARDADGLTLASVDKNLSPNGHAARNMKDLFGLSSFTGSLEVTSTVPIVSLSINAEAAPVFSSLPPGELDASAQGSTTYYFPHIAVGAGWQTTITYINYSPEEVTCRTDFLSDHGSPLRVSFAGRGMDISRSDVLPPGGSVHQETNVELSAPLAPGWARATCSGAVKASLLFRLHNSEGVSIAEGGVNAAAVPATRFVTFAEQGEGQFGTGVAYANPSPTEAIVTFTARDADGLTLASVDKNLSPNGHAARNMKDLFGLSSFTGSLEVTSTEPIVSLSINAEAAPVFSSLPPGETIDIPGVMLAPADEAAFNDLFVGKRAATNFPAVYVDFVSPGRFRETRLVVTLTGSYTYRNTGSDAGTLTFNYDDGDLCTAHLTFTSATMGTATSMCDDGLSVEYNWRIVEIPSG